MKQNIPVGIERVLYLAAADEGFRQALLSGDRGAAVQGQGLSLRASELALLRAIPDEQLRAAVFAMDISPHNVHRRSFLQVVAGGAAVVAAAEAMGCSDDDKDPDTSRGIRPDTVPSLKDGGPKDQAAPDKKKDIGAWPDGMLATGIRPGG